MIIQNLKRQTQNKKEIPNKSLDQKEVQKSKIRIQKVKKFKEEEGKI